MLQIVDVIVAVRSKIDIIYTIVIYIELDVTYSHYGILTFPVALDTASFEGIPPCVGAPASLFRLALSVVYIDK